MFNSLHYSLLNLGEYQFVLVRSLFGYQWGGGDGSDCVVGDESDCEINVKLNCRVSVGRVDVRSLFEKCYLYPGQPYWLGILYISLILPVEISPENQVLEWVMDYYQTSSRCDLCVNQCNGKNWGPYQMKHFVSKFWCNQLTTLIQHLLATIYSFSHHKVVTFGVSISIILLLLNYASISGRKRFKRDFSLQFCSNLGGLSPVILWQMIWL